MQLLVPWEEAGLPLQITVVRSRLRQVSWRLLAPFGVSPQQYHALRALEKAPSICHKQLAGALGTDKPTATRLLKALQLKGWVEVRPHPGHGRKLCLDLSPEGAALLKRLAPFRATLREGLEQGLNAEERAELQRLLHKLIDNLDALETEFPAPED